MATDQRNYMAIEEFKELGYLQEVNRLFFHPRGLALEVAHDDVKLSILQRLVQIVQRLLHRHLDRGPWRLSGVWDYRHDPEGIIYDDEYRESEEAWLKRASVAQQMVLRGQERRRRLGYVIQPLRPGDDDDIDPEQWPP